MDAAVTELAQRPQRNELRQLAELARAREVKECVATQGAGRQPDDHAEDGARERERGRSEELGANRTPYRAPAGHERDAHRNCRDQAEGQVQRGVDEKRDDERGEQNREAPGKGGGKHRCPRRRAEPRHDQEPREQQDERRRDGKAKREADAFRREQEHEAEQEKPCGNPGERTEPQSDATSGRQSSASAVDRGAGTSSKRTLPAGTIQVITSIASRPARTAGSSLLSRRAVSRSQLMIEMPRRRSSSWSTSGPPPTR
jgi:hypothetical protein